LRAEWEIIRKKPEKDGADLRKMQRVGGRCTGLASQRVSEGKYTDEEVYLPSGFSNAIALLVSGRNSS
jgi:hypothetical protein